MSDPLFLGAFHFDGDREQLLPAYQRLLEQLPIESLDLHICIIRDGGLTVFDACPSRAIHEDFITSDMFLGAVAAAGLPAPRVESLGDVHVARVREEIRP